jgi:hypothetical protein
MKIEHSIFDFHGAFFPLVPPGVVETIAGRGAALQPGEGVVVEVRADALCQQGVDALDFLEDLLDDVAVRDVPLLGGTQLDEVMDLAEVPGELDIGGYAASRV